MAIVSVGYMGQVSDSEWAVMAPHVGMRYWVAGPGDLSATVLSASARQVRVAPGTGGGCGLMDVLDAPVDVTLPALASGSRVDLVALRRSWTPASTPTGTTSVEVVSGATLAAALGARAAQPGTLAGDDQPIAAFQVTASGSTTTVVRLEDLRVWAANGGMVAASPAVLQVLTEPGTTVTIGSEVWTRVVEGGSASWSRQTEPLVAGDGLTGTPAASDRLVIQTGSLVLVSDQAGYSRITWPRAFTGGLVSVVLTNGDDLATPGFTMAPSGNAPQWGSQALGDRTAVVYTLRDAAGNLVQHRRHRVSFTATGWDA